jgi:hypothetical protein
LLASYEGPDDLPGDDGLFKQLKKALIERARGAELSEHLGYENGDPAGSRAARDSRNGISSKRSDRGRLTYLTTARQFHAARRQRPDPVDGFEDKFCARHDRARHPGPFVELYRAMFRPISSAGSPLPSSMKCVTGKTGRWKRSIGCFSSTRCASQSHNPR